MTRTRFWTRSARRLLLLLGAVVVPPAVTLVWLGVAFAARERDSAAQRTHERQTAALQAAVHALGLATADAERRLTEGPLAPGMARLAVTPGGIVAEPADALLWKVAMPSPGDGAQAFAAAEADEFGGRPDRARVAYEALAQSAASAVRAGALVRLARVHRVAGRKQQALATYERLLPLAGTFVDHAPADLQARRAICDVLGELGRQSDQRACGAALGADLAAGRWRDVADRATWEATAADVARWTGRDVTVDADRLLLSEVADVVESDLRGAVTLPAQGWRAVRVSDGIAHVYIGARPGHALVVSPAAFAAWGRRADDAAGNGASVRLIGPTGESMFGDGATPGSGALRSTPNESGLPWTVALVAEPGAADVVQPGQRTLLVAGLAAILLLLGGSSYFLWRTMSREIEVARLQTEFVAAVSHEFRTPLTSIRHVSELLEEGEALSPEERQAFYASLSRNAQRLQRFVESLLDFARLEVNRRPHDQQPVDAGVLVKTLVADFARDLPAGRAPIDCEIGEGPLLISADASSLGHAVWNLLDNAVKYSPGGGAVRATVRRVGGVVEIAVSDSGIGIPAREQREIFGRFIRGGAAVRLGVSGTGLGLAIVSHVARAHGGAVTVTSVEGEGSTFTMALPTAGGARETVTGERLVGTQGRA